VRCARGLLDAEGILEKGITPIEACRNVLPGFLCTSWHQPFKILSREQQKTDLLSTMKFLAIGGLVVALSWLPIASAFVPAARRYASKKSSSSSLYMSGPAARTLYDKIWDDHVVDVDGTSTLLYIDRHLVHEVTSPQAFEGLRLANRGVRRPDCTLVTVDHNVPTEDRSSLVDVKTFIEETASRTQVLQLEQNVKDFGLKYFGMADERQGIVHIIGPEQGFTLPGCTTVCGDSHTATHGAFGALAFGIGTSEVEHVLATQVCILCHRVGTR
jgi:hypothetical protein